jgi:hypothetical protein
MLTVIVRLGEFFFFLLAMKYVTLGTKSKYIKWKSQTDTHVYSHVAHLGHTHA